MGTNKNLRFDIFSLFILIVMIIAVVIVMYFIGFMNNNILYEILNDTDTMDVGSSAYNMTAHMQTVPIRFSDNAMVWLFFGWMVALIISGIYTNFNPVIMIIFFILLLFGAWFAMQGANFYSEMSDQLSPDILGDQTFTMSDYVFKTPFPIMVLVGGIIALIIMYAKRGQSSF